MRYRLDDALNKAVYGEACTPKVRAYVNYTGTCWGLGREATARPACRLVGDA